MIDELISIISSPSFWAWFLVLLSIPYGMFLVAFVFEGRRIGRGPNDVPFWRDQSRAFLPGDAGLALFVAVPLYYGSGAVPGWSRSLWFLVACSVVGFSVFLFSRKFLYSEKDYTQAAWRSPSKVYHDFVMLLMFSTVAIYLCIPFYFMTSWWGGVLPRLVGLFGLCLWVAGMVYDIVNDESPNDRQHPSDYRPIWSR